MSQWARDQSVVRFWSRVDKSAGPDGCWLWTGAKTLGYGRFHSPHFAERYAHRLAYVLARGPIPDGLELDHACHNRDASCRRRGADCPHRACCNPDHLAAVTHQENKRGGMVAECVHGHPYDQANTLILPNGGRRCRACNRRYQLEFQQRRRAALR